MSTHAPISLTVAPWVMQHPCDDALLLLGPRWGAYQLTEALEPAALDPAQRQQLADAGVLVATPLALRRERSRAEDHPAPMLWISADDEPLEHALEHALRRHAPALFHPRDGRPTVVLASAREELDSLFELADPWLDEANVLCFGESSEGLHCGPWIRDRDDIERYQRVLRDTTWAQLLAEHSLPPRWPTSLPWLLRHRPEQVAAAVASMMTAADHDCILVDDLRPVDLWTRLETQPATVERFLERQRWSKGALRQLEVERVDHFDAYVAHASSPCAGEPHLSDNFGKGTTPARAERVALGETVERLAAWFANRLPECSLTELPACCHPLIEFHPNGPAWTDYLDRGAGPVPLRLAHELLRGTPMGVPSFLVPFPFTDRRDPLLYRLDGHTSGLAAYPDRDGAVLRATLELLERHDLYPRFFHEQDATRVSLESLRTASAGDPLAGLLEQIDRESELTLHVLRYPDRFGVPLAHGFLHDAARGFISRGSGSGLRFTAAVEGAVLECLLGRREALALASSIDDGGAHLRRFREWARPEVVEHVVAYLEAQPVGSVPPHSFDDEGALLRHLGHTLHVAGHPVLVVDLPCPIVGWSAVRVLVPGLTTHQIPSDSAGGRRLRDASFPFSVPT